MKPFRVQRWETRNLWHRFRYWFLFRLNLEDEFFLLPAKETYVRVAKTGILISGYHAFNVYIYLPRNPLIPRYSRVLVECGVHPGARNAT